ncbi:hypothetical protein VFPBJ_01624 [Purpureocillium lilacinum]|uniref:Uncharacterized protein n=1 Tax=Purpureocillium lilacinum TaxID=33203 RepID=A0A179HBZ5_PURLI|nr:hypothetical protein VFPBJ_01624 [Purpureocillium lilacinum]
MAPRRGQTVHGPLFREPCGRSSDPLPAQTPLRVHPPSPSTPAPDGPPRLRIPTAASRSRGRQPARYPGFLQELSPPISDPAATCTCLPRVWYLSIATLRVVSLPRRHEFRPEGHPAVSAEAVMAYSRQPSRFLTLPL